MLWLTLVLAVGVGVLLGLLGGGGSILTVPLLVYVAGLPVREAIVTSLVVVGVNSAVAVVPHARGGRVRWRSGVVLGVAAMVGAYVGGRLAAFVPDVVLLVTFALMMLATSVAMIRGRRSGAGLGERELPVSRSLAIGVAVGLATGFVGAGGGFLVVPALVLLGGLPMSAAVGTSLLVIALNSAAGLAGHLEGTPLPVPLMVEVTAATLVGALIGARLAPKVSADRLRTGFGWFVLVMGLFVLTQSILGAR